MTDDDIRMFRSYREEPVDPVAKERARARLLETASSLTRPRFLPSPRGVGRSRRVFMWRAAAPAVAAVALVTTGLALTTHSEGNDPFQLTGVTVPAFPLTPGYLPAGLGAPSYSMDDQGVVAVYQRTSGGGEPSTLPTSSIFIRVSARPVPAGSDEEARQVDVTSGVEGRLWLRPADRFAALMFKHDEQWIKIGGQSDLADPDLLRHIASRLLDRPHTIVVSVGLVPSGWELSAFKDDTATYDDPRSRDPKRSLTVTLVDGSDPRLITDGLGRLEPVAVGSARAETTVRDRIRYLTLQLADGRRIVLAAPEELSLDDLVRIARTAHATGQS